MTLQNLQHNPATAHWLPPVPQQESFPVSGPVNLHPALDEVRRMPEFQMPQDNFLEKWLDQPAFKELGKQVNKILSQLTEALVRFLSGVKFPGATHLPEHIRDFFSGFVGVLIVLAGLFAFYLLLGIFLRWTEQRQTVKQTEPRFVEDRLLMDSAYHSRQAKNFAGEGDYTEGIRQWYLALLCLLDERRLAPFSETRSNREYWELLGLQHQAAQSPFGHLASQFEKLRYGNQTGEAKQFEQCETWYSQLKTEIPPHV